MSVPQAPSVFLLVVDALGLGVMSGAMPCVPGLVG